MLEALIEQVEAAGIKPNRMIRNTIASLLHEKGFAAAQVALEKAISAIRA